MTNADHEEIVPLLAQIVQISIKAVASYNVLSAQALDGIRAAMTEQGVALADIDAFIAQSEVDRANERPAMIERIVAEALIFAEAECGLKVDVKVAVA